MRSKELNERLRAKQRTLLVLWAAISSSVGMFVVFAFVLVESGEVEFKAPFVEDSVPVLSILAAVALGSAAAAFLVPGQMLSDERLRQAARVDVAAASSTSSKLSPRDQQVMRVAELYVRPWIIGLVLTESVALAGLLAALLTGDLRLLVPFVVVAVGLILVKRPNLEAHLRRASL